MSIKFTIPNVPTAVDYTATSVSNNGATIPVINKPTFSTVATSGAYTDLTGKPTLATVATSGAYTDLVSKPVLATVATSGAYTDLVSKPTFATVATSGKYDDLTGNVNATNVAATGTLSVTGTSTLAGLTASELTKTNALAATWYTTSNVTLTAGNNVTFGNWALQPFSKVPTGLTLLNGSNQLVFPYNGIYSLDFTANLSAIAANEISMWFQSVSGTYGTTSRRLGSYDQASGTVNAHCSYLGYFAAGDVMIAGMYAQSANTSGGILSMVLIARTP
jgi:hypothetical protein